MISVQASHDGTILVPIIFRWGIGRSRLAHDDFFEIWSSEGLEQAWFRCILSIAITLKGKKVERNVILAYGIDLSKYSQTEKPTLLERCKDDIESEASKRKC